MLNCVLATPVTLPVPRCIGHCHWTTSVAWREKTGCMGNCGFLIINKNRSGLHPGETDICHAYMCANLLYLLMYTSDLLTDICIFNLSEQIYAFKATYSNFLRFQFSGAFYTFITYIFLFVFS